MTKYVCATSGLEFETESKIHFSPTHPKVSAFKRDSGLPFAAVQKTMEAVKAGGGYTTVEEFLALVTAKTPAVQQAMEDERKAQIAMREAANQRERERRAEIEAANHAKLREAGLNPRATRKEQNALLKAYGYTWKKIVVVDESDPDDWSDKWILTDPDGATISLHRALDEIKRGRDTVRAEIAAREAAEKAAEPEREARREAKHQEAAAAKAREDASIEAFEALEAKIKNIAVNIPYSVGLKLNVTWTSIAKIEATSTYRRNDEIAEATVDGVKYYRVITNTGFDDDGYYSYYMVTETIDDLWSSGD